MAGTGIVTAGLAVGGRILNPNSNSALVEQWNGSAWTEVGDINTARYSPYGSKFNYSDSFVSGGSDGSAVKALTEDWNGASWAEVADLNTARQAGGSAGTNTGGLVFGGAAPSQTAVAEEWITPSFTAKTVDTD